MYESRKERSLPEDMLVDSEPTEVKLLSELAVGGSINPLQELA